MKYPYLGATLEADGVRFRVVSPGATKVEVVIVKGLGQAAKEEVVKKLPMTKEAADTYGLFVPELGAGAHYYYLFDGVQMPDPASRFQPSGVHGPSEVIDPYSYLWQDHAWQGVPYPELVFYELHVGTFTPEGSYKAAQEKLPFLKALGVRAVQLMPLAAFPGERGWGYDPAALFAPTHSYGTPDELRAFVDAAHQQGLAVYLDVIYNHLGPDGAYIAGINPQIFSTLHTTPWGRAINFDGDGAAHIRQFYLENAAYWLREFHLDGYRLDATHALIDDSKPHILQEIAALVHATPGFSRFVVAEDERNDRTMVLPAAVEVIETTASALEATGYGLDGVWADDFHHQVRVAFAGDSHSYFQDFTGTPQDIALTLQQGWFFTGQATRNGLGRGTSAANLRPENFVICIQNHDQVGNRPQGNRLSEEISPAAYRAASALLLFAPQLPLIFQGQEWGTKTPFIYFTDHNEALGKSVSQGRREEFKDFPGFHGDVPDPQEGSSFTKSKLNWQEPTEGAYAKTLQLYQDLLHLRRDLSGPIQVQHLQEDGFILKRNQHLLFLTFKEGVSLPLLQDFETLLISEAPRYAELAQEPTFFAERVHFPVPTAILAREPDTNATFEIARDPDDDSRGPT